MHNKKRISENATVDEDNKDFRKILENFCNSIVANSKPLDGEISKFVDNNFWDLI